MQAEGIRVDEIDLNLPGACYYLCWKPAEKARQTDRDNMRAVGRDMGWAVYATSAGDDAHRLLFGTVENNLDAGLARLMPAPVPHHLYLVHPETALQPAARYIRAQGRAPASLPNIHHGLFMGERMWAEQLLTLLINRSTASLSNAAAGRSLAEIAKAHADRRQAIAEAYRTAGFSLKDIAEHFDMHFSEVSAVINAL